MKWLGTGVMLVAIVIGVVAWPQLSRVPPSGSPIGIDTVPVLLNAQNPSQTSVGDFHYAGGLALTSRETNELHGLSDIEITGTDKVTIVGDSGVLLTARLLVDNADRLVGLADARLAGLTGEDGKALSSKTDADAEGLALLPNGDRLVSFERRDRILLYPAAGGAPRPVPMPAVYFPVNGGMEALAGDPENGEGAYVVGAEVGGATWTCSVTSACTKGPTVDLPEGFNLVSMKRLPGTRTVYLLRAYDEVRRSRISLQVFHSTTLVALMDLAPPMTVDNYEGVAAVPRTDGSVRFYLLSDDNGRADQRTLLLAFDWRPR